MGTYVSLCEYCTDVKWVLSVAVWFLKKKFGSCCFSMMLVSCVCMYVCMYLCEYVSMYVCLREACTDFFGGLVFEK
jgi:hypothetical protein